ncbi:PfkB family carbohydrate kinase [Isoptericola sp. AK164]|uniref:PfkB family carbohydrate kinase n=1 Tax=Isoptericola sp. AK164 TaxID=3024246 RepID=UPI00241835FE|nr:PfkB family carbohydrate kinase [Isoptericola sp. AK164]
MSDAGVTTGRVMVIGSANEDFVFDVEAMPRAGETVVAADFHRGFGGKGANQAVAAARAGAATHFVGAVGRDDTAATVVENLVAHGVGVDSVQRVGLPTGRAAIVVDRAGRNQIVVAAGANGALTAGVVDAALAGLGTGDVVVLQCEIDAPMVEHAAVRASGAGARVLLNLAPYVDLRREALVAADVVVVNESEALALSGARGSDARDAETLARAAGDAAGTACLLTLGERGSVFVEPGAPPVVVPADVVEDVVDTTGAGDVYVGTLAAVLANGASMPDAMVAASSAAARSVRGRGAQLSSA